MGPVTLFEPTKTPKPTPNCCSKAKVLATLQLLPIRDVTKIVEQNEVIEVGDHVFLSIYLACVCAFVCVCICACMCVCTWYIFSERAVNPQPPLS